MFQTLLSVLIAFTLVFNPFLTSLSYPDGSAANKLRVYGHSLYLPLGELTSKKVLFQEKNSNIESSSGDIPTPGSIVYATSLAGHLVPSSTITNGHRYSLFMVYQGVDPLSQTISTHMLKIAPGTPDLLNCGIFSNSIYSQGSICHASLVSDVIKTYEAQPDEQYLIGFDGPINTPVNPYDGRIAVIDMDVPGRIIYQGTLAGVGTHSILPDHVYLIDGVPDSNSTLMSFSLKGDISSPAYQEKLVDCGVYNCNKLFYSYSSKNFTVVFTPNLIMQGAIITITDLGNLSMYVEADRTPAPENPCLNQSPQKYVADPINVRSGNFTEQIIDISVPTRGLPLEFERSYNSLFANENSANLGPGWTHNYAMRLVTTTEGLALVAPHGSRLPFGKKSDGTFEPGQGVRAKLVRLGNIYSVIQGNGITYVFDGENNYRLMTIADRNGNVTTLVYSNSTNLLERVNAPDGIRYLSFKYSNNLLTNLILEPEHRTITYTYNLPRFSGYLAGVIDPEGRPVSYNYSDLYGTLTMVSNAFGTVMINTYFAGKVMQQTDAFGKTTYFDYQMDHTKVTDPIGHVTYYTFTKSGLPLITEDYLKRKIVYEYDNDYNPVAIINSFGDGTNEDRTELTWDSDGCGITKIEDALENTTWMTYTDVTPHQLKMLTDARGNTTEFQYDTRGNLTVVTNALKSYLHFTYSLTTGQLLGVENPLTGSTQFHYDNYGYVNAITDAMTNATVITYNVSGQITQIRDARGQTMTVGYDRSGLMTAVTDTRNYRVMTYTYDMAGRLIEVDPLGRAKTLFTYEGPSNRVLQVSRINGMTPESVAYAYDEVGRVTAITDAIGHYVHYSYDSAIPLVTVTNQLGEWTSSLFDKEGKLIRVANSAGQATTYSYNAANRLTLISDDNQHSWVGLVYDRAGNIVFKGDSAGRSMGYIYDKLNRVEMVTNTQGILAKYTYDRAGNLSETVRLNATVNGSILPTQTIRYTYDALNRLTQVFEPETDNKPHQYGYDSLGNLIAVTNTKEYVTTYLYDELNRLIQVQDPMERVTVYGYDDLKLTQIMTQAPGTLDQAVITATYDSLGRLASVEGSKANVKDITVTYAYTSGGQRTWMTDTNWVTAYEYDKLGRPISIAVRSRGNTILTDTVLYSYPQLTQPTTSTLVMTVTTPQYPDGYRVKYIYNTSGQLKHIVDWSDLTTTYHYSPTGELVRFDRPGSLQTLYSYDSAGRPVEVLHLDYRTSWRTLYRYELDKVGNRIAVREVSEHFPSFYLPIVVRNVSGGGALAVQGAGSVVSNLPVDSALISPIENPDLPESVFVSPVETPVPTDSDTEDPVTDTILNTAEEITTLVETMAIASTTAQSPTTRTRSIRYTYDLQNRLTSAIYTSTIGFPFSQITYTYDRTGNRTAMAQITNGLTVTTRYAYNNAGQLTNMDVYSANGQLVSSTNYLFDHRGNLIYDGEYTYTYDSLNQMVKVQQGLTQTAIYTYNGDGLRLAQNIDGVETRFTWDQAFGLPQLLETSDGTRYLQGIDLEGVQKENEWYYPLTDLLGSVRQWRDSAGGVTGTVDYDPFGVALPQVPDRPTPIGFAGEWEDSFTGLQYLQARWYQPEVGRFTQIDPFPGFSSMPATQNPYIYGLNNPVRYTDPSGWSPVPPTEDDSEEEELAQSTVTSRMNDGSNTVTWLGFIKSASDAIRVLASGFSYEISIVPAGKAFWANGILVNGPAKVLSVFGASWGRSVLGSFGKTRVEIVGINANFETNAAALSSKASIGNALRAFATWGSLALAGVIDFYDYQWGDHKNLGVLHPKFASTLVIDWSAILLSTAAGAGIGSFFLPGVGTLIGGVAGAAIYIVFNTFARNPAIELLNDCVMAPLYKNLPILWERIEKNLSNDRYTIFDYLYDQAILNTNSQYMGIKA